MDSRIPVLVVSKHWFFVTLINSASATGNFDSASGHGYKWVSEQVGRRTHLQFSFEQFLAQVRMMPWPVQDLIRPCTINNRIITNHELVGSFGDDCLCIADVGDNSWDR